MKKYVIFVCLITLWGCSKNVDIPLIPDNSIEVSHITNDDLDLVDGFIQLIISKEEAIERGVPASEYDLVEETLARHNKSRVQTKSVNSTIEWGMLQYPAGTFNSDVYLYSLLPLPGGNGGSLTLYYSMGMRSGFGDNCTHTLVYNLSGWTSDSHTFISDSVSEFSSGEGAIPFPYLDEASLSLNYYNSTGSPGICVYDIRL
jgi:hypothetical protein